VILPLGALAAILTAGADSHALDLLREAQSANAGRYAHGELRATLQWEQKGAFTASDYAETRLVWAGAMVRAEVLDWGRHNHDFRPEPGKANREYWIIKPQRLVVYMPGTKGVTITSPAKSVPKDRVLLWPSASWYGRLCGLGISWREILDPQRFWAEDVQGTGAEFPLFSATDKADDLVEITVLYPRYKAEYRLLFSFAMDGNPLKYEFKEPSPSRVTSGSCDWRRDERGRLFLSRRVQEVVYLETDTKARYEYNVLSFNPDVIPDRRQFELDSLNVPAGTIVSDELNGRRRRVGDRPVSGVVPSLDGLIDLMRSRGFASTERK
jgi:hypothetical protein